jgi:hypothetical protein
VRGGVFTRQTRTRGSSTSTTIRRTLGQGTSDPANSGHDTVTHMIHLRHWHNLKAGRIARRRPRRSPSRCVCAYTQIHTQPPYDRGAWYGVLPQCPRKQVWGLAMACALGA